MIGENRSARLMRGKRCCQWNGCSALNHLICIHTQVQVCAPRRWISGAGTHASHFAM